MSFPWQRYAGLAAAVLAGVFEAFKYHSYTGMFVLFVSAIVMYALLAHMVDDYVKIVNEKTSEIQEILDGAKAREAREDGPGEEGTVGEGP